MVWFDTTLAEEGGKYFVTARSGEKVRIFILLLLTLDGGGSDFQVGQEL